MHPLPTACPCILVCLLYALPCAAAEDEGPSPAQVEEARRHFDMGIMHYSSGNYPAARDEFDEAYRLTHKPDLLFNLSRTSQKMGRLDDAILYLERYLLIRPNAPDAATIRVQIEELKSQGGRAPAPQVGIPTPLPERSKLPPKEQATPLPRHSKIPPWPALALLGSGTGVLVMGIGLGAWALQAAKTVSDPRYNDQYFTPELQTIERRGQALNAAAIPLDLVGGLAIAGGVAWTLYFLHTRREPKPQPEPLRFLLLPTAAPGLTGVALQGAY